MVDRPLVDALERAIGPIDADLSPDQVHLLGMLGANLQHGADPVRLEAIGSSRWWTPPAATTIPRSSPPPCSTGGPPPGGPSSCRSARRWPTSWWPSTASFGLPDYLRATAYLTTALVAMDMHRARRAEAAVDDRPSTPPSARVARR